MNNLDSRHSQFPVSNSLNYAEDYCANSIYLDAPNVGEEEKEYLIRAVDSGFVSTIGPFVAQIEDEFAKILNVSNAVATQSGTAAIHMALIELGIGPGDEVIIPSLTFVATINPILYVGAIPVMVDIDQNLWTMDVSLIRDAITKRTKAIIPVHLYGNACDMGTIQDIADHYNLYVIEDATESLGSKYCGSFLGTIGDFGCFSFNGNKTITTGGGGMLIGKDNKRLEHTAFLVNQAKENDSHPEVGYNYRMTNIEAAMGLGQISKLSIFLDKKKCFKELYLSNLADVPGVHFQQSLEDTLFIPWLNAIYIDNSIDIVKLQEELQLKGIPTRRVFYPLHKMLPYQNFCYLGGNNAWNIYENSLCLPSSTLNSEQNIIKACDVLKACLGE